MIECSGLEYKYDRLRNPISRHDPRCSSHSNGSKRKRLTKEQKITNLLKEIMEMGFSKQQILEMVIK